MGVVYRAFDTLIKRPVAVKTLHDIRDRAALDLFYKEWGLLASLVHPNIVQVYDVGTFETDGETVPFFVMPLLPGVTLSKLIYDESHRLTVDRALDIICQACRGIQAAHEANLVHRDIKPSNILVLDDDSVKIIDFGVAHLVGKEGSTGLKGTPFYMAPEQVRLQGPSALSDIYSLGVVAYEALTRRRPIQGSNDAEIADSILNHIPPAATDINPEINELLSRVLHKAMAKQPFHRFASARDFSETLQKVRRNEPVEIFDPNRIQPRIDRAQRAFDGGEFDFASEVVAELEAEGCLEPQITLLRRQLNEVHRRKRVQILVEGATRCLEEQEYPLALRKVQEALELGPEDGTVLSLKARIDAASQSQQTDDWLRAAEQHLANAAFAPARQALERVIEQQPDSPQALRLLTQLDEREGHDRKRDEAVSWCLAKARQLQADGKFEEALRLAERVLATYPGAPRLERLRDTLLPLVPGAPLADPARSRDLDQLRLIGQQAGQPLGGAIAQGLASRVEETAQRWPGDAGIQAAALEVLRKLETPLRPAAATSLLPGKPPGRALTATGEQLESAPAAEALGGAGRAVARPTLEAGGYPMPDARAADTLVADVPAANARAGDVPLASTPADAPVAKRASRAKSRSGARASVETRPAPPAGLRLARNAYVWLAAAALVCAVLAALAVALLHRASPPAAEPGQLAEVQLTTLAGAKVMLMGAGKTFECFAPDCRLSLAPGEYTVQASLAGYGPARETFSLQPGAVLPLALELQPLPVVLRLISDLQAGSVFIDGEEIQAPLGEGLVELTLRPGVYPVEVRSGRLTISMSVDVAPGRAPRFDEAMRARELQAYVISSFDGAGELRSSEAAVAVQLDGEERSAAADGAVQLAGLSPGLHELTLTSGARQIRRGIEIGEGPALTAILITDRNLGGVILETGVSGAEVLIDNGRHRGTTANSGRARFTLPPGDYTASVSKQGHQTPAPRAFTIRKGDETRLSFELPVKPQMAALQLSGAPPGAEVWLDNQRLGEVDRDGAFSASVAAGPHRVELRNVPEMYAPQAVEKQFADSATVVLTGADLPLRAVKGKLQIQVEPAGIDASVSIQQAGGAGQSVRPGTYYREPGDYIVTASAPGYLKSEAGQRVTPGQTTVFRLTLTREAVQPSRRHFGLDDLAKIAGFKKGDSVIVRRGGEFALLPLSPSAGAYSFTANVRGGGLLRGVGIGKARVEWVVDYADPANHVLFQLGEDTLSRTTVNGGLSAESVKIPHPCPKSAYYSIAVEVTAAAVTHKLLCNGEWLLLDEWKPAGRNLADGKFGFFVPGNSTLTISHFDAVGP
jgi:tetratricopeptide (TPR) repeat protein